MLINSTADKSGGKIQSNWELNVPLVVFATGIFYLQTASPGTPAAKTASSTN
jgi:hypothetical protein